jgi:hypothetical protein
MPRQSLEDTFFPSFDGVSHDYFNQLDAQEKGRQNKHNREINQSISDSLASGVRESMAKYTFHAINKDSRLLEKLHVYQDGLFCVANQPTSHMNHIQFSSRYEYRDQKTQMKVELFLSSKENFEREQRRLSR